MASFTKKAIVESFLRLSARKSPDKITVRDIVDDCEINRNTFYYHFQDIYAVMEEIFCLWTAELCAICRTDGDIEEGLRSVALWAQEHKKTVIRFVLCFDRSMLEEYWLRATEDAWTKWVAYRSETAGGTEEAVRYLGTGYAVSFFSILCRWIRASMREDAEGMVRRYAVWLSCAGQLLTAYDRTVGDGRL
ncbi:MAG: TetR family transcriptional regulator [Ruminococcaceae bacterium]|nr:TetR family transcriptional regulator [Oscillospiraceae bacterium]